MRRHRKHDDDPIEETIGDVIADVPPSADTAQMQAVRAVPAEPHEEPPTGAHGVDPLRAVATVLRIPELAAVTWHVSSGTSNRLDGSLTIPAQPDLRPMSPETARHELERFGEWLAGGPATVRTATEGKRTRVIVGGVLHGVTVTLSALMPPPDPLAATTPPTEGFTAVPEPEVPKGMEALFLTRRPVPTPPVEPAAVELPAAVRPRRPRKSKPETETGDAA